MTIKVANKGQKIIDLNGYVYTVQEVYPKYVSIGNGEYIVHQEYKILPSDIEKEVEELAQLSQKIYSKYGSEVIESVFCNMLNRFDYINEGKVDPRHVWTFEECDEPEGAPQYEYPEEYTFSS